MTDFFASLSSYIVLAVTLIGWFSVFVFMMLTDRKISKLEKDK